eukprot:TRINITY_DN111775_c0_g1_i1.p1 TRINITY_DN111775_c0_g1~~TRINITY_DN111775_c0_g1_i1.p1  ORF type:complete len:420 (+),score=92.01 TRINITY_DN111775_c0_g1_i1:60-1319(+)
MVALRVGVVWSLSLSSLLPLADVALGDAASGSTRQCPELDQNLKSQSLGTPKKVSLFLENHSPYTVDYFWVRDDGENHFLRTLGPYRTSKENSWHGHAFRFYTQEQPGSPAVLLQEYEATEEDSQLLALKSCGDLAASEQAALAALTGDRSAEYESLVHDHNAPCEPQGKSSKWSCVRHIPKEIYEQRPTWDNASLWGFATKTEAQQRPVGETFDRWYEDHMPKMPALTKGPGILKMSFTQKLRGLLDFYHREKKASMRTAKTIPGGYTNNHLVKFDEVSLDNFRDVHEMVKGEMWGILRWWTQRELKATDTFGVRIYRRGAMLINHVDRADTHLASAVIQVDQDVDEDGGWPLEAISPEGDCYEVYLQPGELVLYEGGRLKHGRPMRLRGDGFANVFSHFAPMDWYGPHSKRNGKEEL